MTVSATRSAERRRKGSGWQAATWLLLIAFTLQSFITQIHIHVDARATESAWAAKLVAKAPDKSPSRTDLANCPLCQTIVHAGAYFAPAGPPLPVPAILAQRIAPAFALLASRSSVAFGWNSRAPPLH